MATTISTQDIVDAKRDIDDIGKAVNEKVIVSPRYGEDFKSLPMISAEFQISSDAAEAAAVSAAGSANIATSAAQSANSSANIAEAAATSATISAGVFETPEAGVDPVTGVVDGAYYNVRSTSDESYINEYQNVGGVPTPTGKTYPSAAYVQNVAKFTALPFVYGKTYSLNERVQLENGDIVKNTIASNVNDPNTTMVGWEWVNYNEIQHVKTIAAMLSLTRPQDGQVVFVRGYHTPQLGKPYRGGGTFVWQTSSTAVPNDGTIFAVSGVNTGRWVRQASDIESITPQIFGAVGDGVADDTDAIQRTLDYAQTLAAFRQFPGIGSFTVAHPNVEFPAGYYKVSRTLELGSNRVFSISSNAQAVIFGVEGEVFDLFSGTHVWKLYVSGITFHNFDCVFRISSQNLSYATWHFSDCSVRKVNNFVDSISYVLSRSTNVIFDRCSSQVLVAQFARLFCDTVAFNECWLSHNSTNASSSLIYGNSLFSFKGCAFLPSGTDGDGVGKSFVHLSDDDGAGGTVFDKNRGVSIDSCRLSNEGGNPPLVVADYQVVSPTSSQGGPLIAISNMILIGFHPKAYELNGTETGVVQILKYPEAIAFSNCTFDALGNNNSYLVAKNSTVTVEPHNRFNIWLDAPTKKSAANAANNYGTTSKIADSLRGFINNPDPEIFRNILEFGYIPVVDSATEGTKKATLKLKTGWSTPVYGVTPTTFMLILTGQNSYSQSSAAYAGSSVYIVSLTGEGGGYGVRNRIQATKLHGPAFSYGGDANADIVSIHFGTDDTGSDVSAIAGEQTVTVTFGANIRYGKAKIINYIERDGYYANKPQV